MRLFRRANRGEKDRPQGHQSETVETLRIGFFTPERADLLVRIVYASPQNRAKLSSVCKGFIGFFGGALFLLPSPSFLSLMKEKKAKENQGAKGDANLGLVRIRVSGRKIFCFDGGVTVKAQMKIPRCDSSGHIGVTIDHFPQDQKLF